MPKNGNADPEINTIQMIWTMMSRLDRAAQARVMTWLEARLADQDDAEVIKVTEPTTVPVDGELALSVESVDPSRISQAAAEHARGAR
jgi:hypothetical protein